MSKFNIPKREPRTRTNLKAVFALLASVSSLMTFTAGAAMPVATRYTNSIGTTFVRIESGSFKMGEAEGGDWDERPIHQVRISRTFYLATTEITNEKYEKFDPSHRALRGKKGFSTNDSEAVVFVSWLEATRFCDWLSKKEGLPYRLPTEAEWEYACRAGTDSAYHTGKTLPGFYHTNQNLVLTTKPKPVPLEVGKTPPNAWGLFDMHGNVEEWCQDWYGPYESGEQVDPVGRADGDFRVTRGGSHSTEPAYLRSANRSGTIPEDTSWCIGFRVVLGESPKTKPLPLPAPPLHQQNVQQKIPAKLTQGPDPTKPYFKGPRKYVKIPSDAHGPLFSKHNHDPAIVECPNGDLLTIWYSCLGERGRELTVAGSRLRFGAEEWEPATTFWNAPDRNDHAPALGSDGHGTLYHFNSLSIGAAYDNILALVMRTSTDSGATWSKARLVNPEHTTGNMPVEAFFRTREGALVLASDAQKGGSRSIIWFSTDEGKTWTNHTAHLPVKQEPAATIKTGHFIAGLHACVAQLADGRLMALGRGDNIENRMPKSLSADMGKSWTYQPTPFPGIGGGQRAVLLRLKEGPFFFASFANGMMLKDAQGNEQSATGIFAALSYDEGETWPVLRLLTDNSGRTYEAMDSGTFKMTATSAEPNGYMSGCQTPDGVIQLISSKNHYAFNVAWIKATPVVGFNVQSTTK